MSEFLLNLARRSVGLGPVVEARGDAVSRLPRATEVAPPAHETPRAESSAPHDSAVEANEPAATVTPAAPLPIPAFRVPIAAAPAPLIQREPARVAAAAPAASAPAALPLPAQHAPALPLPSRTIEYRVESRIERQIAPIHLPPSGTQASTAAPILREDAQPRARAATPALASEYLVAPRAVPAAPVGIERAETRRPQPAAAGHAATPPERTIHVRIGAIEIHGDVPPPPAAAPPAAPAPETAPAGGFDEFQALRSYAPWAR